MIKALTDTGYRYFVKDTAGESIVSPVFSSLREAASWEGAYLQRSREDFHALVDNVITLTEEAPADYIVTRAELAFVVSAVVRLEAGEELDSASQDRLKKLFELLSLIFKISPFDFKLSATEERVLLGRTLRTQLQIVKAFAPEAWKDVFQELNLNLSLA